MGRCWGGFLPQNEVVKLHWAAVEMSCAGMAAEVFRKLLATHKQPPDDEEFDEASLPALGLAFTDPSQRG